jgi:hypothetical protein
MLGSWNSAHLDQRLSYVHLNLFIKQPEILKRIGVSISSAYLDQRLSYVQAFRNIRKKWGLHFFGF